MSAYKDKTPRERFVVKIYLCIALLFMPQTRFISGKTPVSY